MAWGRIALGINLALLAPLCLGDTVQISNGDRITGDVVGLSDGKLVLRTAYAGELSIEQEKISNLRTESTVKLLLVDDAIREGRIVEMTPDTIVLATVQGSRIGLDTDQLAYINPPKDRLGEWAFDGDINLGLNATGGNTDTLNFHVDGAMALYDDLNRFGLDGQYNLQRDSGDDTVNNARVDGEYQRILTPRWYALWNLGWQTDAFKDLNHRITTGPGLGYRVWKSEKRNLSLEGGVNYTDEDFETAPDDDYLALRWALKLDYWVYKRSAQFFLTHHGLDSVEDLGNLVLLTRSGFRFPFGDDFRTTLEVDIDYDNQPAPGTEKTDTRLIVTGGYSW